MRTKKNAPRFEPPFICFCFGKAYEKLRHQKLGMFFIKSRPKKLSTACRKVEASLFHPAPSRTLQKLIAVPPKEHHDLTDLISMPLELPFLACTQY